MPSRPVPAQSVKRAILHYTSKYTSEHLKCASALRGAVAGHLNAAWKDAATRRRCVAWLLDLEGEIHFNDLTDGQVLALKKWIDPRVDGITKKWIPAPEWWQETEWVAAEACPVAVTVAATRDDLLAEKKQIEKQISDAYWNQARHVEGQPIPKEVYVRLSEINSKLGFAKEYWQITQAQAKFVAISSQKHRQFVAGAYFTGKPVPPEVLADYPDLTHPAPDLEPLPPLVAEAVKLGGMVTAKGKTD
jgi:hypothetical protein